ncbi:MAG: MBL fold metallo-hydrolase [Tissierellia bacterium]|nr:MBL fold metallo-hydrolase [Tissierellia bacterium]
MNFRFCSLASGSSGNCLYIETNTSKFLIDAGLSGKRIEILLKGIGVSPDELDAIFVTHEHSDHSAGVGVLARRYDLKVFGNENTIMSMGKKLDKLFEKNIEIFSSEKSFEYRDILFTPIPLFHDASEAVGYSIEYGNKKISIVTDTGWISNPMKDIIRNSDIYYIEANHDEDMLKNGFYPWPLKQRILSTRGHLSNEHTANVLTELLNGKNETVILGHLSKDNNTPDIAYETVAKILKDHKYKIEDSKDLILKVAPRYEPTDIIEI